MCYRWGVKPIDMMKSTLTKSWMGVLAVLGLVFATATAGNLGEMLREAGWSKIIGTWVDAETKGERVTITYAWKYEDQLIESTSTMGELKSTSLIGVHGKTGDVYHVGANNRGGAVLGKWTGEDGDAVLEVGYVSGEGEEGKMKIRHAMQDDDTMEVTVEGEDGTMTVKLVRKK